MNADALIVGFDRALRAVSGVGGGSRPVPEVDVCLPEGVLDPRESRHSAGLMRVNHVGEACAQALYQAQALASPNASTRSLLEQAAREEQDHLAWTAQRLRELDARPSALNPFWYVGAFTLGWLAGKVGDKTSLGLVLETERQVEQHLAEHLEALPERDGRSRAIVEQMRRDEVRHGQDALKAGGVELPSPVRLAMRAAAKVMTTTAYYL